MGENLSNIGKFQSLPFSNAKLKSFFTSKTDFAKGARYAYEYVTDMNMTAKNDFYPHKMEFGEDYISLSSRDGLVQFMAKLDNDGVGRDIFFSAFDHEHKIDLKTFEFAIRDNSGTDEFSVSYSQTNAYTKKGEKGQFKTTLGVENYNAQGFVSGLKSVVLTDNKTKEVLQTQSVFEFVNEQGELCSETLTLTDASSLTTEPSDILNYRLDMLSQVPVSSYTVNGQRANGDQIIDIMTYTQNAMQSAVSATLADSAQTN